VGSLTAVRGGTAPTAGKTGSRTAMKPRHAAEKTAQNNSVRTRLPLVGDVELPGPEELVFIGGVTALALIGIVEWPVAVLLSVGHTLATRRHNKIIREFGEALEEA
jgi:hypothetical protein